MKLKEFNSENTISLRSGNPRLSITKSGTVAFNKYSIELLKINGSDQVKFFQDEEDETQWYVEKVSDKGFKIRKATGNSGSYIFSNAALARQISESTEAVSFLIAGQPTKLKDRSLFGLLITKKV